MTMFTTSMGSGRSQVLVDEQQLAQLRAELARRGGELERLKAAMEVLAAINAPARFMASAMALCNEMASRWKAERVGIGFLRGRYVRLQALSHTEKITRHMAIVQAIEAAMEECLDQDVEVMVPPPKDAGFVYRAAEQLATKHGPNTVCSFPLRRGGGSAEGGNVVAVLTIERTAEAPFTIDEVETLRLTCDLFTARLADLYEHDRWIGVKAAKALRRGFAWGVGAKHTWAKVAAIAVLGVTCFAVFCKGTNRVESQFVLEASEKQIVPAPFQGFIKTVNANVGDLVMTEGTAAKFSALADDCTLAAMLPAHRPATVMATLNTAEISRRLAKAQADYNAAETQARVYLATGMQNPGESMEGQATAARAQAAGAQAEIDLYQWQIDQATIKAPLDGVILSGDLRQKIGAPVKEGDELYQVGELAKLRAELSVPEDQVTDIRVGYRGQLASSSYPDQKLWFTVDRINPIATVSGTSNVFKVRVVLDPTELKPWMKPGMEGIAKVNVGTARYIWLWTHRPIDWVRMKLWL
ncbi:MAG TPA: HlyD family efflux transporter periplasmic adaptor subunit [Phycisphaerae bacterium]|nr:HlyD family efflux transporter periplasmic adaptor subunit [Phycisphaerae bacterium]